MEILYLTLSEPDLKTSGIYADLLNALIAAGHGVTVVFAGSPENTAKTVLEKQDNAEILRVKVGQMFGVGFIKKGLNTLKVEPLLKAAIKKYLQGRKYDVVLYATPPVTFGSAVAFCKKMFGCKSYLMLKDIFPQNAVDIGLFKNRGLLHRIFKNKEKQLYHISDYIGCMSKGNISYVREKNTWLDETRLELFPNAANVTEYRQEESDILTAYSIPKDRTIFVFGGNLGKPQAIDFLLKGITRMETYAKAFFVIIGSGSERQRVVDGLRDKSNGLFIEFMSPEKYNQLIGECDVGILSLDVRFTIPNYPSRTLGYMAMKMPILACTDRNTDIRELIEQEAECGLWNASDDYNEFEKNVKKLSENSELRIRMGENGRQYLEKHFSVQRCVKILEDHFKAK